MRNWLPNPALFNWRRTLFVIFVLATVIRLVFIFTLQDGFYFADSWRYVGAANRLIEHGEFPTNYGRAPLYPLFLSAIYSVAGDELIYTRIVQAILGGVIAIMIALIGRQIGGRSVGFFAGFLWAIYPMGAFISGLVYPTTLLTVLMAGGVLCLVTRPDDDGYSTRVGIAGFLFGLGVLAKPIVLASIAFVAFWIFCRRRPGSFLLASIFLLASATALVPWSLRNAYVHDRLVPIEARSIDSVAPWAKTPAAPNKVVKKTKPAPKGKVAINIDNDKNATQQEPLNMLIRMAERYPGEFLSFFELYPRRVGYLNQTQRDNAQKGHNPRLVRYTIFGSDIVKALSVFSVGSLYLFAIIGIGSMWADKTKRRQFGLLVLLILSFALGYAFTWGKIRYRIPVDPYIIILSAWGLVYSFNSLVRISGGAQKEVGSS